MFTKVIDSLVAPQPEAGMVTAEYAVGTVAATSLAGLILWIIEQPWFRSGLMAIFKAIF